MPKSSTWFSNVIGILLVIKLGEEIFRIYAPKKEIGGLNSNSGPNLVETSVSSIEMIQFESGSLDLLSKTLPKMTDISCALKV